jgi:hypothetical protein
MRELRSSESCARDRGREMSQPFDLISTAIVKDEDGGEVRWRWLHVACSALVASLGCYTGGFRISRAFCEVR